MKAFVNWPLFLTVVAAVILIGCSRTANPPHVAANIRVALDQAGLKKVSVDQDRDKGVVTLGGHVSADVEKRQAEALAKSLSAGEVVANQIAVLPLGAESDARAMNSDLDKGIEQNLDAALIQNRLRDGVRYTVKSRVITLTGDVDSQAKAAGYR
jgi:osmotically-inducible protein OsmY